MKQCSAWPGSCSHDRRYSQTPHTHQPSITYLSAETMTVMYKSLRTGKSHCVQCLCLVVAFGVQTRKVTSLFGKGFETNVSVFLPGGHLVFHPQADHCLQSWCVLLTIVSFSRIQYLKHKYSIWNIESVLLLTMLYMWVTSNSKEHKNDQAMTYLVSEDHDAIVSFTTDCTPHALSCVTHGIKCQEVIFLDLEVVPQVLQSSLTTMSCY